MACQLAKIQGAKVVGIAGGPVKCKYLEDELGVDVALDYRSPDFAADFIRAGHMYVALLSYIQALHRTPFV